MAKIALTILVCSLILLRVLCLKEKTKASSTDAYLTFCIFLALAALYDIEIYSKINKIGYLILGLEEALRFIYLTINLAGGKKDEQ